MGRELYEKPASQAILERSDQGTAQGIVWTLTDLYQSIDDPKLSEDILSALSESRSFSAECRALVSEKLEPEQMAKALARYEALLDLAYKPLAYARLLHSSDTARPEHGALLSRAQDSFISVQTQTMFFELDWIALNDEVARRIMESPECSRWKHFLESTRRYRPHALSEKEEIILTEKAVTGSSAFSRLFDELTSTTLFDVELEGAVRQLNQSEALALLYNPDREVRRAGHAGFTRGLEKTTHLTAFILNTVLKDHAVDCRLRSYSGPAEMRHLANEIDAESVEALMAACENHRELVQDYYRLKTQLLGLESLYDYDRYAPVSIQGAELPKWGWGQATELVLAAYQGFSPVLGDIVREFFENKWIDAEPRVGKRGGAFCASTVPSVHPYILVNFTGKSHDVMTLAHELGHGVHQYLSRQLGMLQASTPLTLAETASVFGEMLTFSRLISSQDPKVKLSLLCHRLEDSFATVFRQVVLTRFEQAAHAAREKGELSVDQIDRLWLDANLPMHGEVVELTQEYRRWWSYIGHFIHSPFYCYAYSFGELLVLALWNQYGKEGEEFVPKYLELLSSGGSDTPANLVARVGLDIRAPEFWELGLATLRDLLREAQGLARGLGLSN